MTFSDGSFIFLSLREICVLCKIKFYYSVFPCSASVIKISPDQNET